MVELINKLTGKTKTLEFFHAQRLLNINKNFDISDKSKFVFDGKEIVKQPKKKKTKPKEDKDK